MVYVPASRLHQLPAQPWKVWTAEVRAVRASCRSQRCDDAAKWQLAEERNLVTALWAAAFAKCAMCRGLWVLADHAQKRAWLNELQGKCAAQENYAN